MIFTCCSRFSLLTWSFVIRTRLDESSIPTPFALYL